MASLSLSASTADSVMPFDIRLMNGVASTLYVLAALALLAAALLWLTRSPGLSFRVIQLEGELQRNSVATIRANATPRLAGNFISIDLDKARAAFESVPWVRQATLRRIWPDRLAVRLDEHHPVALWQGDDGNQRLVNDFGEVFEANVGDVEDENLPQFSGPEGTSAAMLALYRRLAPLFTAQRLEPVAMQLSGRGSWSLELDSGATVVLGRGSEDELVARSERFLRTVSQVIGRFQRDLEYADLRHADGYAVRLRGITTTLVPAGTAAKKPR
jgi:cell division protein FtsQ